MVFQIISIKHRVYSWFQLNSLSGACPKITNNPADKLIPSIKYIALLKLPLRLDNQPVITGAIIPATARQATIIPALVDDRSRAISAFKA